MGVPKFFRYISERYPCLSEFVKEYQIPEFDNLYLDMNGIIHMCSHPDDGDAHFRITEEKIFSDIFHYIEVLFRMIKPQKQFFMAIDGVAPRAKMNQQRGRRFRSAKDAERLEMKAVEKGEVLPPGEAFDSNCITPGTVFMARLHEQLKYFVVNKITTDKLWRKCKVVLSGHETPGEGEHKIMDYIRYLKAQPGYDPNTRHCLYGLDADLIMLGLCTHEPHFSLLREEVLFGKKSQKRKSSPEQISFYLLHLSLMREYLELEFQELKSTLPFEFNIENIIDDWVLMSFLVGNDFIPHLPNFHIANGALPMLYNAYIHVLPSLGGYINEGGHLHLDRFERFIETLCSIDMENFSEHYADLKYFEAKTGRRPNEKERTSYKPKKLEEWKPEEEDLMVFETLEPEKPMSADLAALIKATDDMFLEPSEENLDILAGLEEEKDEDEAAQVDVDLCSEAGDDEGEGDLLNEEFKQHKKDYYMNKLDYKQVTPDVMRAQAECYVRAIQWNLNYYYNGVCSWGWYYPHHYAPFISDIKGFQDINFKFELGKPFKPYEQLLAVLPAASKTLLPECYHHLMTEENSVIKDYYPPEFNTDLNGKRQDWEAVVLIPFIDENILLGAMAPCNLQLSPEEVKRNTHGPMMVYEYTEEDLGDYEAPEYYPIIRQHHASCTPMSIEEIRVPKDKLIKGAYPGVVLDVYYPGFPTMKHLKYTAKLDKAKVKVFDQPSRGENMIISISREENEPAIEVLAKDLLGKSVFVGWPHMVEAKVISLSSRNFRYHKTAQEGEYNVEENHGNLSQNWETDKNGVIEHYRDRLGIDVGPVKILVHVTVMTGRKYIFTPQGRISLEKQWCEVTSAYPFQTIVRNISVYTKLYSSYKNVEDVYTLGSQCFMMGQPHYGCLGTVLDSKESLVKGRIKLNVAIPDEPNFESAMNMEKNIKVNYMNLHAAAARLGISNHLFSRVTGTLLIILGCRRDGGLQDDQSKINIGLNLKYNKKNEEIPGYTRKDRIWLYSQKVIDLVHEYMTIYPHLFEYLHSNAENDIFYEYELFPDDNGSGQSVREIADWLKKQPHSSVERKSCGSIVLEGDVIKTIEEIVDAHEGSKTAKSVVMQVKPHLLYKPDIQMGHIAPDPQAMYRLYDRVTNIRESYTVPLGYTGTVIAVHRSSTGKPEDTVYDVVFDKPFAGGMSLNCSPNRGYRMSKFSLINKSYGQRAFEQKTGKPGQLLQHLQQPNKPQTIQQTCQQQQSQSKFGSFQPQNSAFASWRNHPNPNQSRSNSANPPYPHQNFFLPPPNVHHNPPPPLANEKYFSSSVKDQKQTEPKSQNLFMPYFAQPEQKPNNRKQRAKKNDFAPMFNEQPRQELKVDTDLLKKMLKIDGEPKNAAKVEIKQNVEVKNGEDGVKLSVQDIFAHASAQIKPVDKLVLSQPLLPLPLPPLQSTNNCSLQLLSFYQMQGLGCPHYRYFDQPDGKLCQAQLIMPFSKEPIFGQPASNKEQACENVAKIVLDKLLTGPPHGNLAPSVPNIPVQFPFPPKQWCEPENQKPGYQRNTKTQNNLVKKDEKQNSNTKQAEAVPFVPLQAVRQRVKSGCTSENPLSEKKVGNNKNKGTEIKTGTLPQKNDSVTMEPEDTKPSKPRRKRKMRIAANFSGVPN